MPRKENNLPTWETYGPEQLTTKISLVGNSGIYVSEETNSCLIEYNIYSFVENSNMVYQGWCGHGHGAELTTITVVLCDF